MKNAVFSYSSGKVTSIIAIVSITLLLLLQSYKRNESNKTMYSYVFYSDQVERILAYQYSIEKNDSVICYRYESSANPKKSIYLTYYTAENEFSWYGGNLKLGNAQFKSSILDDLSESAFNVYNQNIIDGTGPMLFNQEYGLVSIINVLGPDFILLSDSNSRDKATELRRQIHQWQKNQN